MTEQDTIDLPTDYRMLPVPENLIDRLIEGQEIERQLRMSQDNSAETTQDLFSCV